MFIHLGNYKRKKEFSTVDRLSYRYTHFSAWVGSFKVVNFNWSSSIHFLYVGMYLYLFNEWMNHRSHM